MHVIISARNLRGAANFIPVKAFHVREMYYTNEMQRKKIKDFSGGWRLRLPSALFINPTILMLDKTTNHLGPLNEE